MNVRARLERLQRAQEQRRQADRTADDVRALIERRCQRIEAEGRQRAIVAGRLAEYEAERATRQQLEQRRRDLIDADPAVSAARQAGGGTARVVAILHAARRANALMGREAVAS